MDIEILEFREKLINLINSAKLPLEVKRLVLSEVTNVVQAEVNSLLQQHIAEREEVKDELQESIHEN